MLRTRSVGLRILLHRPWRNCTASFARSRADLLANPAISGLTVGQHWDHLEPYAPTNSPGGSVGYDWSYLDDAFAEANEANKSVQLIITPGVDSPPWLLTNIPSCDGLFTNSGIAATNGGTVTFTNFPEMQHSDGHVMPLPWNPVYKAAWRDFLMHLNARYGFNPAFVSIAVAGPVCGSPELILPTTAYGSTQTSGIERGRRVEHAHYQFISVPRRVPEHGSGLHRSMGANHCNVRTNICGRDAVPGVLTRVTSSPSPAIA